MPITLIMNQQNMQKEKNLLPDLYLKEECYQVIGAAFETHRELGCGFAESVYQEAFELELKSRDIPYISQPELKLSYKNIPLSKTFRPDLLVYDKIIVELKAINTLTQLEEAQLINYLKVTKLTLGILLNFGSKKVEWRRMINSQK